MRPRRQEGLSVSDKFLLYTEARSLLFPEETLGFLHSRCRRDARTTIDATTAGIVVQPSSLQMSRVARRDAPPGAIHIGLLQGPPLPL
jgi:hypothetical protein